MIIREGRAGRVWDVDGREYVDYLIGSGPMLVGHCHPEVMEVVEAQLRRGTTFFANNTHGIELAERICDAVACAEKVRFVSSGTESDMYSAITAAIGALRGPKHGGANEEAFRTQSRYNSPDEAEADIRERVGRKEIVIGFGGSATTDGGTGMARALAEQAADGQLSADLRQRLVGAGYQNVSQVMAHGEFAVRGSLVDLFPMGSELPYRIDLLDREIDSIRTFDPETQLTTGALDLRQPVDEHAELRAQQVDVDAGFNEQSANTAALLVEQRDHDVDRLDELVVLANGQRLRVGDRHLGHRLLPDHRSAGARGQAEARGAPRHGLIGSPGRFATGIQSPGCRRCRRSSRPRRSRPRA